MNSSSDGPLGLPAFVWRLIFAAVILLVVLLKNAQAVECVCSAPPPPPTLFVSQPKTDSWVFQRSRYTHDPETGARVAQYDRLPAIEPLEDPRQFTSGYSRTRTVLRGPDGAADTYYRVRSYGNGRGGLDAEWERFHDAWRGSTIAGGAFNSWYPQMWGGGVQPYATPYGGNPGYGGGYGPGHRGRGGYGPGSGGPGAGWGAPGYAPAYGAPFQGPIDPDGADGFTKPREPFPKQKWPWEERRHKDYPPGGAGGGGGGPPAPSGAAASDTEV